ncbi:MAG TPA: potassium/proton antiporter [Nocardioidaceae bacterium]
MSVDDLYVVMIAGTLVVLAAVVAARFSARLGLPTLLLYLGIGLALGESGLGLPFEDADLTMLLGSVALAIILAEGGLTTPWRTTRPVLPSAAVLATLGVAVSVLVTAGIAHLVLGLDLRTALILGAAVSSTDAAAVFAVLRRLPVPIPRHLTARLEAESGFNDPPVIILVTIVASDAWESAGILEGLAMMLQQFLIGGLVGVAIAWVGAAILSRLALPASGLYPLATLAIALLAFAVAGMIGGSGFLAVYLAGLWLGNAALPHRGATLGFAEGMAWLAQIGLFVLLGLLASPSRLPEAVLPALVVGGGLLLVARPLSVLVCATPFRVPLREQAFMSWAGLRGAVPIVLATIPLSEGLPGASTIFDVVFVLVVLFTLIQAPLLPWLATRLGITRPLDPRGVHIESSPLEDIGGTLLQFTIPSRSRLANVTIEELRLPPDAAVALILRDGRTLVPETTDTFSPGDHLLVVSTAEVQEATERRLRQVSRRGRLASWLDPEG